MREEVRSDNEGNFVIASGMVSSHLRPLDESVFFIWLSVEYRGNVVYEGKGADPVSFYATHPSWNVFIMEYSPTGKRLWK